MKAHAACGRSCHSSKPKPKTDTNQSPYYCLARVKGPQPTLTTAISSLPSPISWLPSPCPWDLSRAFSLGHHLPPPSSLLSTHSFPLASLSLLPSPSVLGRMTYTENRQPGFLGLFLASTQLPATSSHHPPRRNPLVKVDILAKNWKGQKKKKLHIREALFDVRAEARAGRAS